MNYPRNGNKTVTIGKETLPGKGTMLNLDGKVTHANNTQWLHIVQSYKI